MPRNTAVWPGEKDSAADVPNQVKWQSISQSSPFSSSFLKHIGVGQHNMSSVFAGTWPNSGLLNFMLMCSDRSSPLDLSVFLPRADLDLISLCNQFI